MKRAVYPICFVASAAMAIALIPLFVASCAKSKDNQPTPGHIIVNSIGMKLAYIPAGEFDMASPPDEHGHQQDESLHRVKLSQPFRISVTEITQAQWTAVMASNRSHNKGDDLPVEKVSWNDAQQFCRKLSQKDGRTYRLATEAEWEYACRAGATGPFAGTGNIDEMAWYQTNSHQRSHPVAAKKPNAWGLYDMHGNVAEWCADHYGPDYPQGPVTDPTGPAEGSYRVVRGGSYDSFAVACRSAARSSRPPAYQLRNTGFRVVMQLQQ